MQRIEIIGNIGQDCKIVENGNTPFISFSVAVTERYKNSDGTDVESTQWYNCLYAPKSTGVSKFLLKGKKVFVEGKPKFKTYTAKDGKAAIDVAVQVRSVELLSPVDTEPIATTAKAETPTEYPQNGTTESKEDLPF